MESSRSVPWHKAAFRWSSCVVLTASVLACAGGGEPPPPLVDDPDAGRSATAVYDSLAALQSYTGLWTVPLLAKRLTEQGMRVTLTDSVINYEHLSIPGEYIQTGRGDVHAFFYPDTASARRDFERLDERTAAPKGVEVRWPASPTLVRSLNLVVIFLSNSVGHSERVANGILGGLPAPDNR